MNLYGMGGLSSIEYSYQDHFSVENELITADPIQTYQLKGGVLYNLNDDTSVFFNTGLVEKAPILDNVIYYDGTVASDPANEKFLHNEFGVDYRFGKLGINASAYMTDWQDRNLTKSVTTGQGSSGDTDIIFLRGVNQKHSGVEIETNYMVNDMLDLMFVTSFGNWKFDGDAEGTYQETEYNSEGQAIGFQTTEYAYALDGLYVGDMPQTAYILGVTVKPVKGLRLQAIHKTYDKNYSDWSPSAREFDGTNDDADRSQVWEAPGYSRLDLHMSYKLPKINDLDMTLTGHIFNVLDEVFVQDAVDNSRYNGYGSKQHLAHNAEVFLGTPRYANIGLTINF
jgi:iron complex outermembrane receptor protein